jgi:hypothetical protein
MQRSYLPISVFFKKNNGNVIVIWLKYAAFFIVNTLFSILSCRAPTFAHYKSTRRIGYCVPPISGTPA